MENQRSLPLPTWETGSTIRDPNTMGLAGPEYVLYATSIFHDGKVEEVAFKSTSAAVRLRISSHTGEGTFACAITFLGVSEADLRFDATDVYQMQLSLHGESGYRVKIFTANEASQLDFQDLVISEWEERNSDLNAVPLRLYAKCNFA